MINFETDKVVKPKSKDFPFEVAKVKCEICGELIASCRVDQLLERENLERGFKGSDFLPIKTDWPVYWPDQIEWLWMKCPYCNRRPFYYKAMFTDENDEKKGLTIPCTVDLCPESFNRKQKLAYHLKKEHKDG